MTELTSLRSLTLALLAGDRLNLEDYYDLLVDEIVYMPVTNPSGDALTPLGLQLAGDDTWFGLLYSSAADAERDWHVTTLSSQRVRAGGRDALRSIPDGWGVIIDWKLEPELQIAPDSVTELNEVFHVRTVQTEAAEEWLSGVNRTLNELPLAERAEEAKRQWQAENGFRVIDGSRRARAIEHFFTAHADGERRCKQVWRSAYRSDPYLRHLTASELRERGEGIVTNLSFADRTPIQEELTEHEWMELLQHVECEHERRGVAFEWPPLAEDRRQRRTQMQPEGELFRFSKRRYLEPLLWTGALTLFPAATYSDPSLLPAQRDDELLRSYSVQDVKWRRQAAANYYVWFVTWDFDERLFEDFDADACLVIHDARTFTDRLTRAVAQLLPRRDWAEGERRVRYFDPVRPYASLLAWFHKDFRYAYQREFRDVWGPTQQAPAALLPAPAELPALQCELGSLEDICSLVLSPDRPPQ